MIKFTFACHDWFKEDLVETVGVFLDFEEDYPDRFEWQLKRWSYTPYSVGKMYRKCLLVDRGDASRPGVMLPHRVIEFDSKEALEELISGLLHEEQYGVSDELVKEEFYD